MVRKKPNRKKASSSWTGTIDAKSIVTSCGRVLRRSLPALIVVVVAFGVGSGVAFGYRFVTSSPRFAIDTISFRGNGRVTTDELRAALPIHAGDNTFRANLDAARTALLANPWIERVEIDRVLPHELTVEIFERTPVAIAELGELYLVDASGHPFKRLAIQQGEGRDLPIVTGLDRDAYRAAPDAIATSITTALAAYDTWRSNDTRPAIGEIHIDASGGLILHTLEHATAIHLGALDGGDLAARMETFDATWRELTETERAITRAIRLDTRTDHVTVAFAKEPK